MHFPFRFSLLWMLNIGGQESAIILSGCNWKGKPKSNRKLDKK